MSAVAAGITADSVLIGGASAQAAVNGEEDAGTGDWTPGDAKSAAAVAGALGLGSLLASAGGGGEGGLPDIAGDMSDGYLNVVSRVLAGWDPDVAAAELGGMLETAVADGAYATALTVTQITTVAGQAALQAYLAQGNLLLQWTCVPDARVCKPCLDNAAADPRPAGVAWPSGAVSCPEHPACRCGLVASGYGSGGGLPGASGDDSAADPGGEGEGLSGGEAGDAEGGGDDSGVDGGGGEEAGPEEDDAAEPGPVTEANALADAYSAGAGEGERLFGGMGGVPVYRVTLSDGTGAVVKSGQEPGEALHGYLAGLVARALGIDGTEAALIGDDTLVARFLPGETGAALRATAGENGWAGSGSAELERIMQMENGREIGVLDFLTANADRNDGNYLVDGGTVLPVDHAFANFAELLSEDGGAEVMSPFARYWAAPGEELQSSATVPFGSLSNPLSAGETAALRSSLESLRDEFAGKGAAGEYGFMMSRLAMLESGS